MSPDYAGLFHALLPAGQLVIGALLVLFFDILWARHLAANRHHVALTLGVIALVASAWEAIHVGAVGSVFGDVLRINSLSVATHVGVCLLGALALAFLPLRLRHPAEFVAIILMATTGFSLMASANQLLIVFLAVELASLSLYILAGFDKTRAESAEAGLKYFLFGGMSAAFLLFGFSLIYGLTGSIKFTQIATQLSQQGMSPLLVVGLVMVVVALGFKSAAAPFHLWAPDVYQGAPAPATALIASASKLAGLVVFTRLLWPALGAKAGVVAHLPISVGWAPVLALVAGGSMLLGNIGALAQSNVRRLLAYSAIAHAGVLLLGVITAGRIGPAPLYYYAATYGLATIVAFGVISVLEATGPAQQLTDLAGLVQRSPLLAGALGVSVLSLAGVPPLAGFFGKFAVIAAALRVGDLGGPLGWLALAAIALSAVGLYYYLLILKQAFVTKRAADATPVPVPLPAALSLITASLLLVLLGIMPSWVLALF